MTNNEKRNKYANLMSKLNKATSNEYYYEAIFVEYAILEDRTSSLLKHAKIKNEDIKTHREYSVAQKLRIIKKNKKFSNDLYIKKHITDELIDNLFAWKTKRNDLIHDLVIAPYDNEDVKNIALEGECLIKRLNNKSKLVNNHLDSSFEK